MTHQETSQDLPSVGAIIKDMHASIVKSVYVAPMKAAGRMEYYVTIENCLGDTITPYRTYILAQAIGECKAYAEFFGIEPTPYTEPSWGKVTAPSEITEVSLNDPNSQWALFRDRNLRNKTDDTEIPPDLKYFVAQIERICAPLYLHANGNQILFSAKLGDGYESLVRMACKMGMNSFRFEISSSCELRCIAFIYPTIGEDINGQIECEIPTVREHQVTFFNSLAKAWEQEFGPLK